MTGWRPAPGAGQVRFLRYTRRASRVDITIVDELLQPGRGRWLRRWHADRARTVNNPMPGVWEIVVEARRTSDAVSAPFSVSASVLGTTISPNPDMVPSAQIGTPMNREYTVTNRLAAFNGRLVGGGALGSTQTERPTVGDLAQTTFDVTLPSAGVTSYTIRTSNASDPGRTSTCSCTGARRPPPACWSARAPPPRRSSRWC